MAENISSIFDLPEFKPYHDVFRARANRFGTYWKYYKAEVYKGESYKTVVGQAVGQRIANMVRPLFTPLARAVNLDVALIPGEWQLNEWTRPHKAVIDTLFEQSKWDVQGDLFVKFVVSMGEAALYVVDDRENKTVMWQVLRPDSYLPIYRSAFDPTLRKLILFTEAPLEGDGDMAEVAFVLEPDKVRTFHGGELTPFMGRPVEYANPLGFVPAVVCQNDPGDGMGEPTFDDAIASLDQVNLQATYLANIIQKHAEPQWATFGAEPGDLEKSGDKVWFFPEGSDVKAVLAQVDFEGVLKFIQEVKEEVKESLPELAIAKLVGVQRVAAATIELQLAEAVFKIRRLRKPIDMALAEALRMTGKIATDMGNSEVGVLDVVGLGMDKKRPVITLDALTRTQIQQAEMSQELQSIALERERAMLITEGEEEELTDA